MRKVICGRKVIGVAGFKNAGKTTLVAGLVRELTGRGYVVSTVKHAHCSFDIDHEGRDSFRHRQAGAREVAVVARERWAIIHEAAPEEPPACLEEMLVRMSPCDLVIVEGYKGGVHPKIEVRNLALDHPPLAGREPGIVAVAASGPIEGLDVPVFLRDDHPRIADFVIDFMELGEPCRNRRRDA